MKRRAFTRLMLLAPLSWVFLGRAELPAETPLQREIRFQRGKDEIEVRLRSGQYRGAGITWTVQHDRRKW